MTSFSVSRRRLLELVATGATVSVAGCGTQSDSASESTPTSTAPPENTDTPSGKSIYTEVYRQTIDSVVQINTDSGQGSGFVFDDTHIVTNAHVVGHTESVEVRFRGENWRTGRVVGTDVYSDIAVVEVSEPPTSATPLPFIEGEPTIGQEVVVIGNPFGLDGTVTAGIVSGINRSIPSPAGYRIPDSVQTDAAVNPGNSGGPLVSLDGEVVAVINSGGGENVGFGISAALTKRVVAELIETGSFEHSYVGVSLADVTPEVADANGFDEPHGILVVDVMPDSPADGVLQPSEETEVVGGRRVPVGGDAILAIEDTDVLTSEDLGSYLSLHTSPGDTVTLTVLRDGTEQTVELTLGTRPAPENAGN